MGKVKQESSRYDLLVNQPVEKVIVQMAIPTIISMMISSIYNMADTYFVSQLGTSASGAVGIIFSAMAIIQAISFTIGMGSGNFMARCLGAGQQEKGEQIASTAFFTGLITGTIIGGICLFHVEDIVMLLGSTETIKPYAVEYAKYIFLATPFMMCSFIMNNLLRLQGLAIYAMVGITLGGVLNMILDPIFIFGLGMGTSGAAIATGLSQLISFTVLLCQCNLRKECISIRLRNFKPSLSLYGQVINGGMPSLGRQGMASLATIVLNTTARPYGDAAIAAMAIVNRFIYMINSAVIGFGQGFQPVCGFSFGAKKYDRVKKAFWFCVKSSTAVLLVISVVLFLFSGNIIGLFRKDDIEVINIGTTALRLQILTMPLNGYLTMGNMFSQSIGYGVRATILSLSRQGLFLIPILVIGEHFFGLIGIQMAQPLADICTFIISTLIILGILKEFTKLEEQAWAQ
ncbi:MAG: MATE family efflux transporter [Lachnoclostridium edouardi]|uniref:MATE family efflux transporter n=1 Tax=Lachnoclostridium edouardi TaxID=1926283 RepID=UPI0026DB15D5|nr:MATE family efflux transporter [Lachnoclostridium edouardi]MDO4279790.1 MATE family efflux transporter [Lachnoclostridium edouardi]